MQNKHFSTTVALDEASRFHLVHPSLPIQHVRRGDDNKSSSPFLLWCSTGPGGQCPLPYINLLMDSPPFSLAAALPPTGQQRLPGSLVLR